MHPALNMPWGVTRLLVDINYARWCPHGLRAKFNDDLVRCLTWVLILVYNYLLRHLLILIVLVNPLNSTCRKLYLS